MWLKICVRIKWPRSCSQSIARVRYRGVVFEQDETVKEVVEVLE